ncbi:class I SAM-dependent methyltransferase [Longirhabdus pacifica]|uniref:class I SAM-dependent methyltransferase n=1 Tax=Longirhabdus pacifica TaxID=2305227 RepID=UPI00100881AC|nr:class I SAM-dependent methyltransferase [Longirhabdus pacifica]
MNRFWSKLTKLILVTEQPKVIVEIGAERGLHTVKLLEYCQHFDGKVYVIDPLPLFDVPSYKQVYQSHFVHLAHVSLEALPEIEDDYDLVLVDGDHNWYTVYHELKEIEKKANKMGRFPIIILHDIEWPYGRRDMYYNPDTIPKEYIKPHAKKGIEQGKSSLLEEGGFNATLFNAEQEGGEKNGVLTAVEDFLNETKWNVSFHRAESNNGLGIIVEKSEKRDELMKYIIHSSGL